MRIAIDISPLDSPHANRGIGQYTALLKEALERYDTQNKYVYFSGDLSDTSVDLVHVPYFDFFQKSLRIPSDKKTVVTIHDVIPLKFATHFPRGIKGTLNWLVQKRNLLRVDAVMADSSASAKDIEKYTSYPSSKIHVVYLAVSSYYKRLSARELRVFNVEQKYKLPNRFLLYVGDINWNKNIPGLIHSFARVLKNKGFEDLKLVLVGSAFHKDIEEARLVKKTIQQENIVDKVITTGYVEDRELVALYNHASLYIQPSLYEGFGLPVLEALSCGTPVAVSKAGSLPEVAGDAAAYFNPEQPTEIAKTILEVLQNDEKRAYLIQKGSEQANKFSLKTLAANTIKVYEKVLQPSQT